MREEEDAPKGKRGGSGEVAKRKGDDRGWEEEEEAGEGTGRGERWVGKKLTMPPPALFFPSATAVVADEITEESRYADTSLATLLLWLFCPCLEGAAHSVFLHISVIPTSVPTESCPPSPVPVQSLLVCNPIVCCFFFLRSISPRTKRCCTANTRGRGKKSLTSSGGMPEP
jgi:hypothetical protein